MQGEFDRGGPKWYDNLKGGVRMANKPGPQPSIRYCPICKADLRNVPRSEMKSRGYLRRDGTVAPYTHTYKCISCSNRFEINQDR